MFTGEDDEAQLGERETPASVVIRGSPGGPAEEEEPPGWGRRHRAWAANQRPQGRIQLASCVVTQTCSQRVRSRECVTLWEFEKSVSSEASLSGVDLEQLQKLFYALLVLAASFGLCSL